MYGYLYCENKGLERLPNNVGFVLNLSINAENLHFFMFLESYIRAQDRAYVRMPRASFALLFQK